MIKIEILNAEIDKRNAMTKKNQPMTFFTQKAYVTLPGEPYPKEVKLSLWPNRQTGEEPTGYEKGNYQLSPKSFRVGKFGDLEISPLLIPLQTK